MRPAVTGLIAAAGFAVLKICLLKESATLLGRINWIALALFVLLTAATQWKKLSKIHPIAFIALGAVIGIVLKM